VFEASIRSTTTDPTAANNQATGTGEVTTVVVPPVPTAPADGPVATPAPTAPAPTAPTIPQGGLPATGSSGMALQLQLAALAAGLGLVLRLTGRRRSRS
jgi:hypothetical protein